MIKISVKNSVKDDDLEDDHPCTNCKLLTVLVFGKHCWLM